MVNPLQPEALEANRRGELSDTQRRNFQALSRSNRGSSLNSAALLAAGGVLFAYFASPTAPVAARVLIPMAALAIAAFLAVRALTGVSALAHDLRDGRVSSVEGAVGKRRLSVSGKDDVYFLDVGDTHLTIARHTFAAAPDAGFVRVYFLPHSRKVVNFEQLPDPAPGDMTLQGVRETLGAALLSHTARQRNEARAHLAGMGEAVEASFRGSPVVPSSDPPDPRPLADSIVGSWTSGLIKAAFLPDGRMTVHWFGQERTGRWSVDREGLLTSDIMGRPGAVEARIVGNQLTLILDGQGLTLTRDSGA